MCKARRRKFQTWTTPYNKFLLLADETGSKESETLFRNLIRLTNKVPNIISHVDSDSLTLAQV
jgi:hypothetical protein